MIVQFPFKFSNKQWIQLITIFGIIFSFLVAIYIKMNPSIFEVGGSFHTFLEQIGIVGPIIFILLQMVQVIYPVIPGGLTCIVGHVVFGPLLGFLYNFLGIFIGSIIAFQLARQYGERFVKSFVCDRVYDKYVAYLDKGKYFERFLLLAFLLPGFPDDFLCMVAGLSKMSLKQFIWITLLGKPATLYLYTLLGYQGIQWISQFFS